METRRSFSPPPVHVSDPIFLRSKRTAEVLAYLLVGKMIVTVWNSYRDYFPPNFRSSFLWGRSAYFFGIYRWAFYAHIISGPCALIAGLVLINAPFRRRFPSAHRALGRVQIACVVLVVAPSGLWMARYAATGAMAAFGFAALALATAGCAMLGWRAAIRRRFDAHRVWMLRCFVLLCSAVVLRLIGGLSEWLGVDWTYPIAAWMSWCVPLAILECFRFSRWTAPRRRQRSASHDGPSVLYPAESRRHDRQDKRQG